MSNKDEFVKDMTKLAGLAMQHLAGTAEEVKGGIKQMVKQQCEDMIKRMDLVSREEFEVVRAMAEKAREEQIRLEKELAKLKKKK